MIDPVFLLVDRGQERYRLVYLFCICELPVIDSSVSRLDLHVAEEVPGGQWAYVPIKLSANMVAHRVMFARVEGKECDYFNC